jgi:GNAT superfamily N-acetyltransferase
MYSIDHSIELRDGCLLSIRPLLPEDRPGVQALFDRLSPQTAANRFHSAGVRVTDDMLDKVTAGHALVADLGRGIVALASYQRLDGPGIAEAAIVVDDANQRRGIGTALWIHLSRDAQRGGVQRLRANVLGSNRAMFRLLRNQYLPTTYTWGDGVVEVDIDLRAIRRAA